MESVESERPERKRLSLSIKMITLVLRPNMWEHIRTFDKVLHLRLTGPKLSNRLSRRVQPSVASRRGCIRRPTFMHDCFWPLAVFDPKRKSMTSDAWPYSGHSRAMSRANAVDDGDAATADILSAKLASSFETP